MSDRLSAEVIGATPYPELDDSQRDALVFGQVPDVGELDLHDVIKVALAQEPPNEGVITAIHASATVRKALQKGGDPQYERATKFQHLATSIALHQAKRGFL